MKKCHNWLCCSLLLYWISRLFLAFMKRGILVPIFSKFVLQMVKPKLEGHKKCISMLALDCTCPAGCTLLLTHHLCSGSTMGRLWTRTPTGTFIPYAVSIVIPRLKLPFTLRSCGRGSLWWHLFSKNIVLQKISYSY